MPDVPPPPRPPGSGSGAAPEATEETGEAGTVIDARVDSHPAWLAVLRGMARTIDVMIVLVVVGGIARAAGVTSETGAAITAVVFNVLLVAYWVIAETRTGTTLGKRLFRLQVRDGSGGYPGLSSALGRNVAPALAVVAGVLGVLLAIAIGVSIVTGRGQGLHDRFVGTRVAVR